MKLKAILSLSLLANVILAVVVGSGWQKSRTQPAPVGAQKPSAMAVIQAKEEPTPTPDPAAVPAPFRWQQLEPANDQAYIRNLRAAGCPEVTIKDILSAAIGHRYDEKRRILGEKRTKGELDAAGLQEAIAQSWNEQNRLLAKLFGGPESFGADGVVAKAASASNPAGGLGARVGRPLGVAQPRATAPLVYLDPDPAWGLDDGQLAYWQSVQDKFVAAIGGPGQNPKDPAYLQRWRDAGAEANSTLKAYFGASKVSDWQMQSLSRMPPPPAQ